MKFEKSPFKLNRFLRHWYSIEIGSMRLSLQIGLYKEFYYTYIWSLKKRRLAFYIGEFILVTDINRGKND